jgi:hypothetical protein
MIDYAGRKGYFNDTLSLALLPIRNNFCRDRLMIFDNIGYRNRLFVPFTRDEKGGGPGGGDEVSII